MAPIPVPYDDDNTTVATWGLELILRWIRDADTNADRTSGLDAAMEAFDHYDEAEHGREVRQGLVAQTICSILIFTLSEASVADQFDVSDNHDLSTEKIVTPDEILAKELSVLEMVHRCSMEDLQWSFDTLGVQLLPLLLEALEVYLPKLNEASNMDLAVPTILSDDDESSPTMVSDEERDHYRSEGGNIFHDDDHSMNSFVSSRSPSRSCGSALWAFHTVRNAVRIITYFASLENGHTMMGGHRAYLETLTAVVESTIVSRADEVNDIITDVLNVLSTYPRKDKLENSPMLIDTILINVCLNPKASDEAKEAAAHFFWCMFENQMKIRTSLVNDDALMEFLTKAMIDDRMTESANWIRCSAVKAAHLLCIPPHNATHLMKYKCRINSTNNPDETTEISFFDALVKMVMDGSESFSAACGLCHLAANNNEAKSILGKPSILDTLAKTSLTNPNASLAAEAVGKILPQTSYALFRRIVLLMTLNPNFCLSTAVTGILERAHTSEEVRDSMAADECIIMILVKASRSDESIHVRVEATKALQYLSIEMDNRLLLLENEDIVSSLAKVILEASYGESSEMALYHESSAYATCALCNLVVDDDSSTEIYYALTPRTKRTNGRKKTTLRCDFGKAKQNLSNAFGNIVKRAFANTKGQ